MNEILSRMVADLFEKAKGGEELSSKIARLRDEIKKVIESENTIFGKFLELVESFREIIPDEKQRYHAAIKALSTTSKLSRQEIVKAVNDQLNELKVLEKGLMPARPGWRDERKAREAKAQEMRGEITKLREKIALLESEEKGILNGIATYEKEMDLAEKAMRELFTNIGAEITYIIKKVEESTAESAPAQPIPQRDPVKSDVPSEKKGEAEQKIEINESSAPQDTQWQKKCSMCGGRMNFLINQEVWQCYSCGYEELKKDEVQGSEKTNAPTLDGPSASLSSNEYQESNKESSPSSSQPSIKTKPCPVCRKKMQWHPIEKAWRCPFCEYERSI